MTTAMAMVTAQAFPPTTRCKPVVVDVAVTAIRNSPIVRVCSATKGEGEEGEERRCPKSAWATTAAVARLLRARSAS